MGPFKIFPNIGTLCPNGPTWVLTRTSLLLQMGYSKNFSTSYNMGSTGPFPRMVHRHISNDLKEMALAMSLQGLPDSEVRELTGISERSLKRLRRTYRDKGKVSNGPSNEGRPRILSAMEVKVRRNFSGLVYLLIIGSFSVTVSTVSLTRPSSSCKLSSVRSSLSRCLCRRLRGPSSGRVIL